MEDIKNVYKAGCGKVTTRRVVKRFENKGTIYLAQRWEEQWVDGSTSECSTADSIEAIEKSDRLFFDKKEAEKRAKEISENNQDREKKLANGYVACSYCGKLVKKEDAVREKIINIKMYGRNGKYFDYCSGKCAGNDQMAHEG